MSFIEFFVNLPPIEQAEFVAVFLTIKMLVSRTVAAKAVKTNAAEMSIEPPPTCNE